MCEQELRLHVLVLATAAHGYQPTGVPTSGKGHHIQQDAPLAMHNWPVLKPSTVCMKAAGPELPSELMVCKSNKGGG